MRDSGKDLANMLTKHFESTRKKNWTKHEVAREIEGVRIAHLERIIRALSRKKGGENNGR